MNIEFTNNKRAKGLTVETGFVVCGDLHYYNAYQFNHGYDGVFSYRLLTLHKQLRKACVMARNLRLPIILNGDIITTGIFDYPVEKLLSELLIEFRDIKIYINLGNHDLDGDNSVIQPLIDLSQSHNHYVFSKPTTIDFNSNYRMVFIPYMSDELTNEYLNGLEEDNIKTIVFIHNSFMGSMWANKIKSKSGISQTIFTKGKLKWVDMVVASHIHKYQILCDGKGFYTSSLMPVDFGERYREHGYHIVDIAENKRYFVISNAPKFVYVEADDIDEGIKKKVNGNIIKILYDKNKTINKERLKEKVSGYGAIFVSFKARQSENSMLQKKEPTKRALSGANAIISEFTSILAEKYGLEEDRLESLGLKILERSIKKKGIETQRR